MGFLDVNLDNIGELTHADDGDEIHVRIKSAEVSASKSKPGERNLVITMENTQDLLMDNIRIWVPIPSATMREADEKSFIKTANRFKDFCSAFDIDFDYVESAEEIKGNEGDVIVGAEDDLQYGLRNVVKSFVTRG